MMYPYNLKIHLKVVRRNLQPHLNDDDDCKDDERGIIIVMMIMNRPPCNW